MREGIDCKGRQWYEIPLKKSMTDITGKKFGRLTAILPTNLRTAHQTLWLCKCDCGNDFLANVKLLRNGHTKSCGCLKKETAGQNWIGNSYHGNAGKDFIDETGNVYGKLIVLDRDKNTSTGKARWKCRCECGTITSVSGNNLRTGLVRSCGCIKSRGEYQIANLLNDNQIDYIKQYSFKDLRGPHRGVLLFDFGILYNNKLIGLIEYNGIQHYIDTDFGKMQREITDKQKIDYCKKNNIPLLILNKNNYDENVILKWINNKTRESEGE